MCPNRFLPLLGLYKTYEQQNNLIGKHKVRQLVKNKPIKIPSETVDSIKHYILNNF